MTTPAVPSVVPTSQRPLNGAISGGLALATMAVLSAHGVPPELANLAGLAASGAAATFGDWSRGELERGITNPLAKLALMLFARVG